MGMKRCGKGQKLAVRGIALGAFVAVVLGFLGVLPALLKVQMAPALLRAVTITSISSLVILAILVVLTFLFGRFYCAFLCPLGILQDLIGRFTRTKSIVSQRVNAVRYLIAGGVFGALACGWATGLRFLDPYSLFGRMVLCTSVVGIATLVVLVGVTLWQKRFFCNTLCPVGTLLGFLAKRGRFRLALSEKCVACGQCAKQCPSNCIDLAQKQVDNERCVRCMNCVTTCPTGAIALTTSAPAPVKDDRRTFLVNSAMLLAGVGTGAAWATLDKAKAPAEGLILPPGAGDKARFWSKCTACQLCVQACPEGILRPTGMGYGPVVIDPNRGACRFDCNRCIEICPTGALLPLTLTEKQQTQIAVAKLNPKLCQVFQDAEPCGDCAAACPVKAIVLRKTGAPRPVKTALCIGCGACQEVCPSAHGKAITLQPIESQIRLGEIV